MAIKLPFLLLVLLLTGCDSSLNASSLDIQQMIINLANTMPSLLKMFTAAAYLMGFFMVLKGVYKLKEYGESRTMMASQTNIWGPTITLITGSMLIYFVSSYEVGLQTIFLTSSPISYPSGGSSTDQLVSAVVTIMQVVGVIAFIRGLLLINSAGGHGAQPGSLGKGLTFIIGGLLAINMYGTWQVLINTLTGT